MAKLKAPLMSLGASGKLGGALVFFPWKGINAVRTYVIPANPQTPAQTAQRGYLTDAVDLIHVCQALAANPLDADDVIAYAALASVRDTPRTWFNELCKQLMDQVKAGKEMAVYRDGSTVPGVDDLDVALYQTVTGANTVTAGDFWYGTTKTALIHSQVAAFAYPLISATIAGLVTGTKYFWQFRSSAHDDFDGSRSGIYYGVAA